MPALTKAEKLLLAAAHLAADGHHEFSAEDLIVSAYRLYPTEFCLKGHNEYPDSNSVLTFLMGKSARLIVTGWLEKTGTKMYRITARGLSAAESVSEHTFAPKLAIQRQLEDALARLLDSTAFQLFREGRGEEITFHQFCRFMGLAAPDRWQKVLGKIRKIEHLTEQGVRLGEGGQDLRVHYKQRNESYSPEDLRMLGAALEFMKRRFAPKMQEWERNATG